MKKLLLLKTLILLAAISSAQIIHVPGDQPSIQAGINAASNGDTVLVDEGTWYENIQFKGKAITVASHYLISGDSADIYNTIIDGSQATDPDSAACVMFVNNEDTTSIIAGFTITNGGGTLYGTLQAQHGGGICGINSGAKIIHNLIIGNIVTHNNNAVGGGLAFTTLSGQNWVVICHNKITYNQVLCDNGDAGIGGGMFSSINSRIVNNTIRNNISNCLNCEADGGGLALNSLTIQDGIFIIRNNLVSNNEINGYNGFGAGVFIKFYQGNLENNIIDHNNVVHDRYWGAGVFFTFPTGKSYITKNLIVHNTGMLASPSGAGGGMALKDSFEEQVYVDGNIFENNVGKHGAGFYARDCYGLMFINNVMTGDSALKGGGMAIYHKVRKSDDPMPVIANNTFYDNYAIETGGGLRLTGDQGIGLVTFNNIFFENVAGWDGSDVYNYTSSAPIYVHFSNIDENNIAGYWVGDNNFPGNPCFCDDTCHLSDTSICINAGAKEITIGSQTYYCPDHDIDGEWRPMNVAVDIGADEKAFTGIQDDLDKSSPFNLTVKPNPSSGVIHLRYSIFDIRYSIFEVYSAYGVLVKSKVIGYQQAGDYTKDLDLSDLPNGIYFIRLQAGELVETAKVILLK